MPPRLCRAVLALTAAAALHLVPGTAHAAAPAAKTTETPVPKASKSSTKSDKPDPAASKSSAVKSSKQDPKSSKPETSKTDPKTGKTDPGKPDPKASKPDPGKPDPKASKTGPGKPDPKASPAPGKPDPKASKTDPAKPDPKASKPDPAKPDPKASKPAPGNQPSDKPAAPPVPQASPAPAATGDGYWLGAALLGPPESQSAANRLLAADLTAEPGPPGTIGRTATLPEAVQWVARWSFTGDPLPAPSREPSPTPLHEGPVPRPGLWSHGVVLHALTITGRSSDGGTRAIRWPQTAAEIVPPGLPWIPAVLLAERAPLFAAPAAHVPPAGDRHALVRRSGSLFILGHADRCTQATGQRVCTHWLQVIARDGDSFRAGYLPAFQVARIDGWIRGAGQNPKAQLLPAGTVGETAQFVLVARTRDGNLHRRTVVTPLVDDAYPAARLRIEGEWATIDFTGAKPQRIALDGSMDARVR